MHAGRSSISQHLTNGVTLNQVGYWSMYSNSENSGRVAPRKPRSCGSPTSSFWLCQYIRIISYLQHTRHGHTSRWDVWTPTGCVITCNRPIKFSKQETCILKLTFCSIRQPLESVTTNHLNMQYCASSFTQITKKRTTTISTCKHRAHEVKLVRLASNFRNFSGAL